MKWRGVGDKTWAERKKVPPPPPTNPQGGLGKLGPGWQSSRGTSGAGREPGSHLMILMSGQPVPNATDTPLVSPSQAL